MGLFSNKTRKFYALNMFPLLTPGKPDREARDYAIEQGSGDLDAYIDLYYVNFRKKYRKSYSPEFMKKYGFDPDESEVLILDKQKIFEWFQENYDSEATGYIDIYNGPLSVEDACLYDAQNRYGGGWSNTTRSIFVPDVTVPCEDDWHSPCACDWDYNDVTLDLTFRMTAFGINHNLFSHNNSPWYRIQSECERTSYTVYLDEESILQSRLVIKYKTASRPDDYRIFVTTSDQLPEGTYESRVIEISTIVPMKENNSVVDAHDRYLRKMLKKLGVDPRDLVDTLVKNKDIDNAYLATLVYVGAKSQGELAALYKTFDMFYQAGFGGGVSIRMKRLNMKYSFKVKHYTKTGSMDWKRGEKYKSKISKGQPIPPDPECEDPLGWGDCEPQDNNPGGDTLTIYRKISNDQYEMLVIYDYSCTYNISGHDFVGRLYYDNPEDGKNFSRMFVPLEVEKSLTFREWCDMHEYSMVIVAYSYEKVTVKWYERTIFKVLLAVVVVFVGALIGGASIGMALMQSITSVAISMVANFILQNIDPTLAALLGAVLAVGMMTGMTFDLSTLISADNFVPTLGKITEVVNNIVNAQFSMKLHGKEEELEEMKEDYDELTELAKELSGRDYVVFIDEYNTVKPTDFGFTPDQFYYMTLGEPLYNFDALYDFDTPYEQRKNV